MNLKKPLQIFLKGQSCPYCAIPSKILCNKEDCDTCLNKSFASHEKGQYWNYEKNNITPREVFKNSIIKFFFDCIVCLHVFDITPAEINSQNHFCPYCVNQKLCDNKECESCHKKSFANNPSSKYWSDKNILLPHNIFNKTHKKYLFDCDICKHTFEKAISGITTEKCCPYCASTILCKNECDTCFNKSFASHEKATFWNHDKNSLKPRQVFKNAKLKYFFKCNICEHDFDISPQTINGQEQFCPYCVNQKLCDNEKCMLCFDKSFANNSFSKYWSDKNELSPRQIFNRTHKKFMFNCRECKHELEIGLSHIRENKLNCIYCGSKELCNDDKCEHCLTKSFKSHPKSRFWSVNNTVSPRQVFKTTHLKYLFDCTECKSEFLMSLSSISNGSWCNLCVNKTEKMLKDWLIYKYGIENIIHQYKVMDGEKKYFYDFYLPNLDLIIELDGLQHFE